MDIFHKVVHFSLKGGARLGKQQLSQIKMSNKHLQRSLTGVVWSMHMPIFQESSVPWLGDHVGIGAWSPRAILRHARPLTIASKHVLIGKGCKCWHGC